MLRRFLSAAGLAASASVAVAGPPYSPYKSEAANAIYNLLFCDEPSSFAAKPGQARTELELALESNPADIHALTSIAAGRIQEGRIRYLAYQRLRGLGEAVPPKQLLGVIVEVPLREGLDTLAAYSEGGIRYINQTGKIAVIEGVSSFQPLVENLFAAARPVVSKIGPWDKARRQPPSQGTIRLTFLVSDGLYFGEGAFSVLQHDPLAGPVVQRATELLQAVTNLGAK